MIETIREHRRGTLGKDSARAAGDAALVRLATRLFALRTSMGLTQEQLAERSGLDQASISEIENGDANPTVRTLGRVAAGLEVDASVLLNLTALPPAVPAELPAKLRRPSRAKKKPAKARN